jgi:O-antigen/teichoic acid export membrane protein
MTAKSTSPGILRAGALSMLALAALGVTRLVHGSLVSHATDKPTYGLVGALLATTMIASLVLPGGISSAASKFIAFHRGREDAVAARAAYRFLSRIGLVSAVALGLAAAVGAGRYFELSPSEAGGVGLLTAAYSLYSIDKAALYGFGRVSPYARLELCTSALAIAATVGVVVAGWRAYLLPLAFGYSVFIVGARFILRRDHQGGAAGATGSASLDAAGPASLDRREMLGYAVVASVGTLAGAGFLQGTQLLASHFAEAGDVAYVAAAVALVAPMYFLPRALSVALFPAMAVAHGAGDADGVRRQADVSTRALACLLGPVFVAAMVLAPQVLTVFGGSDYAHGASVLRLLLGAAFLGVVAVPAVNALASGERRRARIPAMSAVSGCTVGLAVVAALAGEASLGAFGVGAGYLAGTAISAAIPVAVVWREYRMPWMGPLTRSAGLLAVAGGVSVGVDGWVGSGSFEGAGSFAAHVALACVAAAVCVAVGWRDIAWLLATRRNTDLAGARRGGMDVPAPRTERAPVAPASVGAVNAGGN